MLNKTLLSSSKKKQTITFILYHNIATGLEEDVVSCTVQYSGQTFTLMATGGEGDTKTVEYVDSTATLTPNYCYIQPIDFVQAYLDFPFTCTGLRPNQRVTIMATVTL